MVGDGRAGPGSAGVFSGTKKKGRIRLLEMALCLCLHSLCAWSFTSTEHMAVAPFWPL